MSFFSDLGITFLNPPQGYWPTIIFSVVALCLFFAFYRFSIKTSMKIRIILASLRSCLVLILLFIILDPYWMRHSDSDWVGVLVDTSESMSVRNHGEKLSRLEQVKETFSDNSVWLQIEEKFKPKIYSFDSKLHEIMLPRHLQSSGATHFFGAIEELDGRYKNDANLLGWILFSDGNASDYSSQKIKMFQELAHPYTTVGVGDSERVVNVTLNFPEFSETIFINEEVPLQVTWQSTVVEGQTTLRVHLDGKLIQETQVNLNHQKWAMDLKIETPGNHVLDIELMPIVNETYETDNKVRLWLQAKPKKIKVFYAESYYKDDNFFKKALEEDEDFEVSFVTSLIGFAKEKSVPFIKDELYGLPSSREALLEYDIVVLSDVKRSLLSDEQIAWIEELVTEQGGALVMIGGVDSFGDGGYVGSEIEKMLPVEISEEYKKDVYQRTSGTVTHTFRAEQVPSSEKHPLQQLVKDSEENKHLWKTMPLLGGYNYVGRLKPGATALLKHPTDQSAFGPRVILAAHAYGRGRVLAFMSDVTYNWGQWFQDWRHEKYGWIFSSYWRQAFKWLSENRVRRRHSKIVFERMPQLVESLDSFKFRVSVDVLRHQKEGKGTLLLELYKDQKSLRVKEISLDGFKPEVIWNIDAMDAGDYVVKATYLEEGKKPIERDHPFAIHESRGEAQYLKAQHELLQQLSEKTLGQFYRHEDVNLLPKAIEDMQKLRTQQFSKPFWNQPWIYGVLLMILCADWFIRKRKGLE